MKKQFLYVASTCRAFIRVTVYLGTNPRCRHKSCFDEEEAGAEAPYFQPKFLLYFLRCFYENCPKIINGSQFGPDALYGLTPTGTRRLLAERIKWAETVRNDATR